MNHYLKTNFLTFTATLAFCITVIVPIFVKTAQNRIADLEQDNSSLKSLIESQEKLGLSDKLKNIEEKHDLLIRENNLKRLGSLV